MRPLAARWRSSAAASSSAAGLIWTIALIAGPRLSYASMRRRYVVDEPAAGERAAFHRRVDLRDGGLFDSERGAAAARRLQLLPGPPRQCASAVPKMTVQHPRILARVLFGRVVHCHAAFAVHGACGGPARRHDDTTTRRSERSDRGHEVCRVHATVACRRLRFALTAKIHEAARTVSEEASARESRTDAHSCDAGP